VAHHAPLLAWSLAPTWSESITTLASTGGVSSYFWASAGNHYTNRSGFKMLPYTVTSIGYNVGSGTYNVTEDPQRAVPATGSNVYTPSAASYYLTNVFTNGAWRELMVLGPAMNVTRFGNADLVSGQLRSRFGAGFTRLGWNWPASNHNYSLSNRTVNAADRIRVHTVGSYYGLDGNSPRLGTDDHYRPTNYFLPVKFSLAGLPWPGAPGNIVSNYYFRMLLLDAGQLLNQWEGWNQSGAWSFNPAGLERGVEVFLTVPAPLGTNKIQITPRFSARFEMYGSGYTVTTYSERYPEPVDWAFYAPEARGETFVRITNK